jgi:hypothetical protein
MVEEMEAQLPPVHQYFQSQADRCCRKASTAAALPLLAAVPESSSRPLQPLAPAKQTPPAAAAFSFPYPPFLSESVIASITSKLPSPPVDALSPEVAEAAALLQNETANVQRAMRSLQQTWVLLHHISTAASGAN